MAGAAELERIRSALETAGGILREHAARGVSARLKQGGDPVTEADLAADRVLRDLLPAAGDGWLSEETTDDAARLECSRVWVVDPLDGTREFIAGIPEWCVSIGLVEDGEPVAGGIYNPVTEQMVIGSAGAGVTLNGKPVTVSNKQRLDGCLVLASRSEVNRGEWDVYKDDPFDLKATGSVAFKFALVASGLCDATWTLVPKREWDVAAGVALVRAAGGEVLTSAWRRPVFNQRRPRFPGLAAANPELLRAIRRFLRDRSPDGEGRT